MREVFLIGSGFSKAISNSMPLLRDLSKELLCQGDGLISSELRNMGENVEHWMTFLSQPQPWLFGSGQLEKQSTFLGHKSRD
jgi:hypothetical protein